MKRGPKIKPWQERIWKYVEKKEPHWYWTGHTNGYNSPEFYIRGIPTRSVRKLLFSLTYSYSNNGHLTSKCGDKKCVKPSHQNSVMKIDKQHKEDILRRYALHLQHKTTMSKLGKKYGVSKQRIEQILKGAR